MFKLEKSLMAPRWQSFVVKSDTLELSRYGFEYELRNRMSMEKAFTPYKLLFSHL